MLEWTHSWLSVISSAPGQQGYVDAALDAGMAGQPIEMKSSAPYGFGVGYAR